MSSAPLTLVPYKPELGKAWDSFLDTSKNGTFLFKRGYMEYHADRFTDASLMAYEGEKLVALFPANVRMADGANGKESIIQTHGGLTYGGFITSADMTTPRMMDLFDLLAAYARENGIGKCYYKVMPTMYHRIPAEEDLYALFRLQNKAKLYRVDVSSCIDLTNPPTLAKGRKYAASVARKNNIEVKEIQDFETFFALLASVLKERHGATPTHTTEEMQLLAGRFPNNIRLFGAYSPAGQGEQTMLAGTVIYDCGQVVHTQYMATSLEGRDQGALDHLIITLFREVFTGRPYFDFGISTTEGGRQLNPGLISQKEMFGGRAIVHQFYELSFQ